MKKRPQIVRYSGKRVGPHVTAVYDMKRSPPTFDFAQFLLAARMYAGAGRSLRVLFVPSHKSPDGFKAGKFSSEHKTWRLWNVLVPLCQLAGARPLVCTDRKEADAILKSARAVWPEDYRVNQTCFDYRLSAPLRAYAEGRRFVPLRASEEARRYVAKYLAEITEPWHAGVVSITLRRSRGDTRNSNAEAWREFHVGLMTAEARPPHYQVVCVPDQEDAFLRLPANHFVPAALNIDLRMALYEACAMNLGVNNGPMALCFFSRAPYLVFKMESPGVAATNAEHFEEIGFPIGSQIPWATERQRIVWEDDRAEVILREFWRIMEAG